MAAFSIPAAVAATQGVIDISGREICVPYVSFLSLKQKKTARSDIYICGGNVRP